MDVLTLTAGLGAVDATLFGQEGTAQQGGFALGTAEALVRGVPVDPFVSHLGVVHTYVIERETTLSLETCNEETHLIDYNKGSGLIICHHHK